MTQQTTELWTNWTRHRDERSFEALVRPELPHALGFAQRLGCPLADAEDAVQDALARLIAVRDDSPTVLGLRAWLCREVHVRARSRLRSERRRRTREAATVAAAASAPAGSSLAVREEVERALAGLDEDERAAVQLRYLHDLDYREMAVVLATSEGACRKRVHKALARLRARFGDDAAAVVAGLPLPAVRDVSVLVKGAFTKASVASAATGGVAVMATTTQKVAIAAVVAALLGVGGTLAVQRIMAHDSSTTASAAAADPRADEVTKRDAEIARLRAQLSEANRRRATAKSGDETPPAAAPTPTDSTSGGVPQAAGRFGAQGGASPQPTVDPVAAAKQAQAWQEALRQVADPAKRDAAWAEVRTALAGADRTALLAALQTVAFTMDVKLDRQGLRDLLLPSVDAAESPVRLMAWQALINNGIESIDVDKLRGQVLDAPKEIRPDMVQRLVWSMRPTKGAIDGPNADVVLKVLDDPSQAKDTIRALQDGKLNDAVVAKVLEYARGSSDAAQHATHFVLRTMPDKNHDVVAFLLDRAQAGDLSSIEGLQWGIRPEDVAYAGERLRKLYDARSAVYVREQLIQTIGRIGDQSSRDWLTALRDDATQPAQIQSAARSALQFLDRPRR